jgi:alkylation response protein AidB-like acyl-CoA dehydrogenase
MTELGLLYGELEEQLRASVRRFLGSRCDPAVVVQLYDDDHSLVSNLWDSVTTELGLPALLIPADLGGDGGSPREAAVVMEELGRFVAPVPFLTSAIVATVLLLEAPRPGIAGEFLAQMATGSATAVVLVPFSASIEYIASNVTVQHGLLSGSVPSVAGALDADLLIVPVAESTGTSIWITTADQAEIKPVTSLDMTRQLADVSLNQVIARDLVPASVGGRAIHRALTVGAAMLASEQLGVAQWCLDTTVSYNRRVPSNQAPTR